MKLVEWVFEHRIRWQREIDVTQFGFMKGKGVDDAVFVMRQAAAEIQSEQQETRGTVDVEVAFDRVPREVMRWAVHTS